MRVPDAFDYYDAEDEPRDRDAFGPPMTCRHCGSPRVYWQAVKGQHVLYNRDTLEPHRCPRALPEPLGAIEDPDA